MIDISFGKIVLLALGLVFTFWVISEGISRGGTELGQKVAVQYSTISSDPVNGTSEVPEMQAGSSSVNIVR